MISSRNRSRIVLMASLALAGSEGCAHRRDAYYARDPGPGVNVRAPFVNVQVRGKAKPDRGETAARDRDRDDDDDRKLSRLPVDREEND